ncbi:MAG: hypothetical protein HRU19_12450 [Pseudobacteriovorax sp.]|nr:hypothetical protein [Pseudobacteriovorax sp.]
MYHDAASKSVDRIKPNIEDQGQRPQTKSLGECRGPSRTGWNISDVIARFVTDAKMN